MISLEIPRRVKELGEREIWLFKKIISLNCQQEIEQILCEEMINDWHLPADKRDQFYWLKPYTASLTAVLGGGYNAAQNRLGTKGNLNITPVNKEGLQKLYQNMQKDMGFFFEHKDELLKMNNGEYVAIQNGVVVDHAKSRVVLVESLATRALGRVYINKVEEDSFKEKSDLEISLSFG